MTNLLDQLSSYAYYHRDRRNVASHFVGIPAIVVSVTALLSRPALSVLGVPLSPALLAIFAFVIYYLRLDRQLGLVMAALLALSGAIGAVIARQSTELWLIWTGSLFIGGWAAQLVGHAWEGRKPAFLDDVMGLVIGPLFIVAELTFALGLRTRLRRELDERARSRDDRDPSWDGVTRRFKPPTLARVSRGVGDTSLDRPQI